MVAASPGVEYKGFIQPNNLPEQFLNSGCLVLPSTFEPWGLVVHEATSSGLPVIVSDAVGSSVSLVQDGYNGFVVKTGDAKMLAQAFIRVSSLSYLERRSMGNNSYSLSLQFTPKRWAKSVLSAIQDRKFKSN